jgi:hypothetical protein
MKYFKYFALIVFTITLFFSCSTKGLIKSDFDIKNIQNSEFQNSDSTILFKTEINIFKNEFSGITVIKPTENQSHRIVFLNEVGMKFFDLEISNDTFIVHQMFEPLNKKSFINMLVSDFKTMLFYEIDIDNSQIYQSQKTKYFVLKSENKRTFYYLNNDFYYHSIIKKSFLRTVQKFNFIYNPQNMFKEIYIEHKNINFEMNFERI